MAAKGTISSHLSSYFLLYLFVHQAHTGKIKKSFKNIHILGERVRRSNIEDGDCTQCIEVDKKNGFPPIVDGQFRVQFINNAGEYFVKVDWNKPIGRNGSVPKGYWFVWLVERYPFVDKRNPFASVCLSKEKTSFLIDESESTHWRKNDMISIGVFPLPSKQNISERHVLSSPYEPHYKNDKKMQNVTAVPTSKGRRNINVTSKNLSRKTSTALIVTASLVVSSIVITMAIFVLFMVRRRPKPSQLFSQDSPRSPGCIYISYIAETENHTEKVAEFCSWLRKHGYDVQTDIMLTSKNQKDLKELGPWRWAERQLRRAKGVFIVISPSYLKLCGLDEGKTDATALTEVEKLTYSEISQIRNELSLKAYISSRFIPVLFGVKETELPFWIKQMVVYHWPEDKVNDKLLHRVKEEITGGDGFVFDFADSQT